MSEYAKRDIEAIGELYMKHLAAMTAEGLHAKGDIAAELAFRDAEVDRLRGEAGRAALSALVADAQEQGGY